jgi:antitoxin MazE
MRTSIIKWGNSQGIRLPKLLLESANFKENDDVEVMAEKNSIVIKKAVSNRKHRTLKERLENFSEEYKFEEWDTGMPVGDEVW